MAELGDSEVVAAVDAENSAFTSARKEAAQTVADLDEALADLAVARRARSSTERVECIAPATDRDT